MSTPGTLTSIRLGVNIDHVATLRQLRAGTVDYPDVVRARDSVVKGGADQITIHLRGDRRHIQDFDLTHLATDRPVPLNLELAATDEMLGYSLRARPDIVCIVPERREEVTTEGGLDATKSRGQLGRLVKEFKKAHIRVSLFIEPEEVQVKTSHELGADAVEFHTGRYALARGSEQEGQMVRLFKSFDQAHSLKLAVHAGHGLDYANVKPLLTHPALEELNIGHSIVCRAVFVGIETAVKEMKDIIVGAGRG